MSTHKNNPAYESPAPVATEDGKPTRSNRRSRPKEDAWFKNGSWTLMKDMSKRDLLAALEETGGRVNKHRQNILALEEQIANAQQRIVSLLRLQEKLSNYIETDHKYVVPHVEVVDNPFEGLVETE